MPTYLYCLLPGTSDPPPADLAGVSGEPVRRLVAGAVAAWVGTVEQAAVHRTLETARRHDAVVRAAMRRGATPLPARGGQRFDDDEHCMGEIERHERAIAATLDRVADCVEMTVHLEAEHRAQASAATAPEPERSRPAAGAGRGREYLNALRAKRNMEHNVQTGVAGIRGVISRALGEIVRAEVVGDGRVPGAAALSHLVPRANVSRYRDALTTLAADHAVSIRVGGPYPPYSFSEIRA